MEEPSIFGVESPFLDASQALTSLHRWRRSCPFTTNDSTFCFTEDDVESVLDNDVSPSSLSFRGLGGLCATPFWNSSLSWPDVEFPNFTNCFARSFPVWIPVLILWIWAPVYARRVRLRSAQLSHACAGSTASLLHRSKMAAVLFGILAQIADLIFSIYLVAVPKEGVALIEFVTPVALCLTYILIGFLTVFERRHSIRSSIPLFVFYLLHLLLLIPGFQTHVHFLSHPVGDLRLRLPRVAIFFVNFLFVLVQFVNFCLVEPAPALDDETYEGPKPSPEKDASPSSYLTFWWLTSLIWRGYRNPLEDKDVWALRNQFRSGAISREFGRRWAEEMRRCGRHCDHSDGVSVENGAPMALEMTEESRRATRTSSTVGFRPAARSGEPSFLRALVRAFWRPFAVSAFLSLVVLCLQLLSPIVLSRLIAFVTRRRTGDAGQPIWKGYLYSLALFLLEISRAIVNQHQFYFCYVLGIKLRTAILTAVYVKSLKLTSMARQSSTIGEIVNLMAVDAQKFMEITGTLNLLWSAPLIILLAMALLWRVLGPASMAGFVVMCALIPFNLFVSSLTRKLQMANMKFKDARIKLMNEVLNGIKVLKLYAWEPSFIDKIVGIRADEMKVLRKQLYMFAGIFFSFSCAPVFVAVAAFAAYILADPDNNVLDPQKAFVSLALFNIIRFPMNMLPHVVAFLVQISVSIKRISAFLRKDELSDDVVSRNPPLGVALRVRAADFFWDKDAEKPTLSDINLEVKTGSLTAIVGSVGAGKSSLLAGVLGEMEILRGIVEAEPDVAFVPQQAWMQNATVKENVLFGKDLNSRRYCATIAACALEPDMKVLPGGDQTEIGEKGINLSGGQKQRISLARAVYQDAGLYLLDDPLSAVDSHVGKHIFDQVIGPSGLLKEKTRVLVTNAVTFLPAMDQIVVLTDGVISEVGTYKELLEKEGAFAEFIKTHAKENLEDESEEEDEGPAPGSPRKPSVKSQISCNPQDKNSPAKSKLITVEGVERGRVKKEVMFSYLRAVGWFFTILTILMFLAQNGFAFFSSLWLKEWSDKALPVIYRFNDSNGTMVEAFITQNASAFTSEVYLGVYSLLGVAQGFTILFSCVAIAIGCVRACISLHAAMLRNVLASPMSFFDTVPLGRILNRFSKDIDAVDLQLPNNMRFVLMSASRLITTILTIAYVTPAFLITVPGLAILYFLIQRVYVATTRQLKRLDSASRSPIYSFFGETVQGAPTLRAFRRQPIYERECLDRVDRNLMFFFPAMVADRWVGLRLEFVGALVVMFSAFFSINSNITPGAVGLAITYSMQVTQTLNFMVRMSTEFETNVVAVERIKEYSETPTEAAWESSDKAVAPYDGTDGPGEGAALLRTIPPPEWPDEGRVNFVNFSLRYREGLDLVLKGINLTVEPGEKVGVVGRTGAGKSSLTLALFRIVEAAEGKILVDGLDIADLGLHELRRKLSIIPQDPVLFSGTLRMNLDPFEAQGDEEIWRALELAHLKDFVQTLPEKLLHPCTEGGENLSVGQRQLVCLARALLRNSKILVLDEATAAVDLETDALLQKTIRQEFAAATIITIAHRLNTIVDYDKILVLDRGAVAEFGAPADLLGDASSMFYAMAKDANLV